MATYQGRTLEDRKKLFCKIYATALLATLHGSGRARTAITDNQMSEDEQLHD